MPDFSPLASRLQRYSAMLLAPLVLVHLVSIGVVLFNGLNQREIRLAFNEQGVWPWFYALFVVALAVHVPIGLSQALKSLAWLPAWLRHSFCGLTAVALLVLGLQAVAAMLR